MKITILNENNSRINNYLIAEPAFSALIELGNRKILFDTGYSDVFITNAKKMNIDIDNITDIAISHGHNDHTGGLQYYKPKKSINFIAHPNIFDKNIDDTGRDCGCPVSIESISENYNLQLTAKPFYITEKLIFLGEIENNISKQIDDSAIVYITNNNKLFIITGCSHSGIINIVNYAKKITKINEIYGIIGGFHLLHDTEENINKVGKFFKDENVEILAPCHCCDLRSKIILSKFNNLTEICVGDVLELD